MVVTNQAYGHRHAKRFPIESVPGVKIEWDRFQRQCYDLLTLDIGNKDLYDIHTSMQKQVKQCKQLVSAGTSLSIDEVELCYRSIELGFKQCREAASLPETLGELKSEILLKP